MKKQILFATVVAVLMLPAAGMADRGNGNGNGNGNGRAAFDCPPGLAKKDPPCVPPGLARQGVTFEDRYNIGDILDDELLDHISELDRYDLPALPEGQRYAIIDDTIVRLDAESDELLQLIRTAPAMVY